MAASFLKRESIGTCKIIFFCYNEKRRLAASIAESRMLFLTVHTGYERRKQIRMCKEQGRSQSREELCLSCSMVHLGGIQPWLSASIVVLN
jgi:hypothetical protein